MHLHLLMFAALCTLLRGLLFSSNNSSTFLQVCNLLFHLCAFMYSRLEKAQISPMPHELKYRVLYIQGVGSM
jgi:hypothetical protein